jgi:Ca2+-binding RTX toxin-like protein
MPHLLATSLVALGIGIITAVSPAAAETPTTPACTLSGTATDDVPMGTGTRDVICGTDGDDLLAGRAGDDVLDGGAGDDVLLGSFGDDVLLGGPGDDLLVDRTGTNVLDGGPGDDRCYGSATTTFRDCETTAPSSSPTTSGPSAAAAPAAPGASQQQQQPRAATSPHFVRDASTVTVRADDLVVTFEEAGLTPGATADIEISATRTVRTTCSDPTLGLTVIDTSSSASALETAGYTADDNGHIRATRTLAVAPGRVEIGGLDCKTETRVTVTLRDLTHDSALTITR